MHDWNTGEFYNSIGKGVACGKKHVHSSSTR